jgi:hypothetical protein
MWSFLTTKSLIRPLPGYVEDKAANGKSGSRRDNDSFVSQQWLMCRDPVM